MNKCTSEYFVAPVLATAKKYGWVKVAMDAKPKNAQIVKDQSQMRHIKLISDITMMYSNQMWR